MGGRGAEKEAYELGRVLEELPPGALGLGHPDRRHHLLPPAPLQAAAAENKLLTGQAIQICNEQVAAFQTWALL